MGSGGASGAVRLGALLFLFAGLLGATGRTARGQDLQRAVRFQISAVGDTTFTFEVGKAGWVRAGAHGIAVDPRRRDALVAKFEVLRVDRGTATALITGETMRLTLDHFAVLEEPKTPWFAQRPFWLGAVLGALVGVGFGSR